MTREAFATLEVGDIVQIDPAHNPVFGGCCLQVETKYAWGVQGPVVVPVGTASALAYCRIEFAHIERIGRARWMHTGQFITDLTGGPAGVAREAAGLAGVTREAAGEAHPDAPLMYGGLMSYTHDLERLTTVLAELDTRSPAYAALVHGIIELTVALDALGSTPVPPAVRAVLDAVEALLGRSDS